MPRCILRQTLFIEGREPESKDFRYESRSSLLNHLKLSGKAIYDLNKGRKVTQDLGAGSRLEIELLPDVFVPTLDRAEKGKT